MAGGWKEGATVEMPRLDSWSSHGAQAGSGDFFWCGAHSKNKTWKPLPMVVPRGLNKSEQDCLLTACDHRVGTPPLASPSKDAVLLYRTWHNLRRRAPPTTTTTTTNGGHRGVERGAVSRSAVAVGPARVWPACSTHPTRLLTLSLVLADARHPLRELDSLVHLER